MEYELRCTPTESYIYPRTEEVNKINSLYASIPTWESWHASNKLIEDAETRRNDSITTIVSKAKDKAERERLDKESTMSHWKQSDKWEGHISDYSLNSGVEWIQDLDNMEKIERVYPVKCTYYVHPENKDIRVFPDRYENRLLMDSEGQLRYVGIVRIPKATIEQILDLEYLKLIESNPPYPIESQELKKAIIKLLDKSYMIELAENEMKMLNLEQEMRYATTRKEATEIRKRMDSLALNSAGELMFGKLSDTASRYIKQMKVDFPISINSEIKRISSTEVEVTLSNGVVKRLTMGLNKEQNPIFKINAN